MDIDKDHAAELLSKLNGMRENHDHCDFVIKVGLEKIPVHKNILCAGSEYFQAMLSHDTMEAQSGIVDMKEICLDSVKKCIDYIYTGNLSLTNKTDNNFDELMNVASIMQLQKVYDDITLYLENTLCLESFFSTRSIAYTYHCIRLAERCNMFALENFRSVVLCEGFKYFEEEYILYLISSKDTKASESFKCKALMVWANHDIDDRTQAFQEIFQKLDLEKISRRYRKFLVENEPLIISYDYSREELMKLTAGVSIISKDINLEDKEDDNVIAVFDKSTKSIQAYNPQEKTWSKMQDFSDAFLGKSFCTVVVDESIYVFLNGGTNYRLQYSDNDAIWIKFSDRITTTKKVEVVALGGLIYSFDDSNGLSEEVEKYNPLTDEWSHATIKPVTGYSTSFVAVKDSIYCIGGVNSSGKLSCLARYNAETSSWTKLRPMKLERYGVAAALLDDQIYVLGGQCGYAASYANVECFDIDKKTWSSIANLNHHRHYFKAYALDGILYAVGGENSRNTIEAYNPSENKWKVVVRMEGYTEDRATIALHLCSNYLQESEGPKDRFYMWCPIFHERERGAAYKARMKQESMMYRLGPIP